MSVISHGRYLAVSWYSGYNGGFQQTFFVENKSEDEEWKRSEPVFDKMEKKMSKIMNGIIPNNRHYVRVLSKNDIGESKRTKVIIIGNY